MKKFAFAFVLGATLVTAACGGDDYIMVERPVHHNILVSVGTPEGERFQYLCETQRYARLRPVPKAGQKVNDEFTDRVRAVWADHYLSNERCPDIPLERLPASVVTTVVEGN